LTSEFEVVIAGGGPAGLAAAEVLARAGREVLVLEQGHDIGSPIRTSGGSFVDELDALAIPPHLYHPVSRGRFLSPHNVAAFQFAPPRLCVIDVRGVFQYLAERAISAGAHIRLGTAAAAPRMEGSAVTGVRTRNQEFSCRVAIDATGYHAVLLKQAGLDPGFQRFGVGAEYDLFAPHCDQDEAVLIVGDEVAPSGYAWVFPWGRGRVRVGVGVIHPDSRERPGGYLDRLVATADHWGVDLRGAQPIEHHAGLIPSERFAERFAGDGIIGVGDAVGNASSLLGEGIRWAIVAGGMAGEAVDQALQRGDVSRRSLMVFEERWRARFGADLRLAHRINRRISSWNSAKWDRRLELLKLLTPDQFVEALKSNLTGGWLWKFLRAHPGALARLVKARV
jgi:digeranylgeranylglycerophospholipid reductase